VYKTGTVSQIHHDRGSAMTLAPGELTPSTAEFSARQAAIPLAD